MRFAPVLGLMLLVAASLLGTGCAGDRALAPVGREAHQPAREYIVQKGDTLYYVAWRFAKDYAAIARYNALTPPYTIYAGQRLLLEPPPRQVTAAAAPVVRQPATPAPAAPPPQPTAPRTQPGTTTPSAPAPRPASPAPAPASVATEIDDNVPVKRWTWPTRGPVLKAFGSGGGNGMQIGGKRGQPIVAAAPGTVVYSGSGLIGYGKLIIVKHNKKFLSAYAHNDSILVNEGDRVDLGQQIAQMGSTGTDRVKLHFEIRRDGKPVDPKRYLPD